mgnify:CR=1 FL=1
MAASSTSRLRCIPIPSLGGRRLARIAKLDGQRPAPLEGLGSQPHVDASNVDSRGGCHAAQHQRQKLPSRLRHSQRGPRVDASFRAFGHVLRNPKRHQHGILWMASTQWVWRQTLQPCASANPLRVGHLEPALTSALGRGQSRITTSTLRFRARPSSVSLSATGFDGPSPWVSMRSASTPLSVRKRSTAAARS